MITFKKLKEKWWRDPDWIMAGIYLACDEESCRAVLLEVGDTDWMEVTGDYVYFCPEQENVDWSRCDELIEALVNKFFGEGIATSVYDVQPFENLKAVVAEKVAKWL